VKYTFLTIRITGPLYAGKSFTAEALLKIFKKQKRSVYHHKVERGDPRPSRAELVKAGFSVLIIEDIAMRSK